MKSPKEILEQFKRGPADIAGIDIKKSGVKVVRIKHSGEEISLVAADILPAIELSGESPAPLNLSTKLKAKYACITLPAEDATIKLLSFPGQFDGEAEAKVVDNMGLDEPDNYRISYKLIQEGHGKSESRVLTVALLEEQAEIGPLLFPTGLPAPFSLEISGLAAMTSFAHVVDIKSEAVGAVFFEEDSSTFTIFNKGLPALVRRFKVGTNTLLQKVQETLGVNKETAQGIIADGAFDISQAVTNVMTPLVKQMIISRDFVERRENCKIEKVYVSGGITVSRDALSEIQNAMGLETNAWNPFEKLTIAPNAIPDNLVGREWEFSAAVGACLATLEEQG